MLHRIKDFLRRGEFVLSSATPEKWFPLPGAGSGAASQTAGGYLYGYGTSTPADGTAGYAPGAIFINTGGTSGNAHFINQGTVTSCSFRALSTTEFVTFTAASAAQGVDGWVFTADRAYQVISVSAIWSTVSTSGTFLPRKITAAGTDLPGGGTGATLKDLITAAFNTSGAFNTNTVGTLSATASDLQLATNDKIGIKTGGTMTGLAGFCMTIVLKPI